MSKQDMVIEEYRQGIRQAGTDYINKKICYKIYLKKIDALTEEANKKYLSVANCSQEQNKEARA